MSQIAYTVTVTLPDEATARDWLRWLTGGHIDDVLAAGASDAELVQLDEAGHSFAVRYHFASAEAFADYERDYAPRLRAEGLRLFPVEKGVAYRRCVGTVMGSWLADR
ncbi:MAG TPA: DUF4286 family protein [Gemmataceae bacterium]|nr:DUF4286 family protein [Gemmataceae bacterium]